MDLQLIKLVLFETDTGRKTYSIRAALPNANQSQRVVDGQEDSVLEARDKLLSFHF